MIVLVVFAIIAAVMGIIGSVVPGLPGPPISWVGLLLLYFAKADGVDGEPMSLAFLGTWLAITIAVTVLDYLIPIWFTKLTKGHKAASTGAIIGLFVGMLVPPVGIVLGGVVGAFIGELLVTDKGVWSAFKASLGAFLGFLCGTGIKLIASGVMFYYVINYIL